jgi:adenosylmethionine-8-amino-7-oxononanoate aminotransferase
MPSDPRSRLVERDKKFVWHPYTPMEQYRADGQPLVIERASRSRIFDMDGRSIIDGNASWWTSLLGHNHPRLIQRLREQSELLCHTSLAGITHAPAVDFAEAIINRAPPGLTQVFFSDNGSTAVEAALKMALQFWAQSGGAGRKKQQFISLQHAFHGETMGVTRLCGVGAFAAPFQSDPPKTIQLPSPAFGEDAAIMALEEVLLKSSNEIAGLVVEPLIQGAGGMLMYAPRYLAEARLLCDRYDVLFIVDEVFTGYGRTGQFWACDHAGVSPDILCSAKGLSGGILPFAATLVAQRIFDGFLGAAERAFYYGHTFCGNPLGASIAAEVLAIYEDEDIVRNAKSRSEAISASFERMGLIEGVESSRSLGVCGALNLRGGGGYLARGGWEVFERALVRGAYVRPLGDVVYITPALNIPEDDLEELLQIVEASVGEVASERENGKKVERV